MIDVENVGRVRLLRLNRPEAKNAFNEAQYDSLTELLLETEGDSTVAVVVITGQGDSFSSGTDVVELGNGWLTHRSHQVNTAFPVWQIRW